MTFQELKNKLIIKNGTLTITNSTFKGAIASVINASTVYNKLPLVISRAMVTEENEAENFIEISGKADFMNIPELPLTAQFFLDETGETQFILKYQLREKGQPKANAWKFSTSFPDLPAQMNYDSEIQISDDGEEIIIPEQTSYLDSLYLYDSHFVVSSEEAEDEACGVELKKDINFVSKMKPQGMLGILENTLGMDTEMVLFGHINLSHPTQQTLPMFSTEFVWDKPEVPGIHLQARMDADFSFGKMKFGQTFFRIYSPVSSQWLEENDTYQPVQGYTGLLSIPSADIEVELNADLRWGMPEALLFANCEGITLGKMTQLLDVSGSGGLTKKLPKPIQSAVDKLETLEFLYLSLQVDTSGVNAVSFTIGMPNLNWNVWDDHFEMKSIACRFDIDDPFVSLQKTDDRQSSFAVTVMGSMDIEGIPVSVSAKSADNFTLYAQLDERQTIPLNQLMKKYTPGVPAPSDLTIDRMAVTVAPGQLYAFSINMAGEPNPWVIPVGPSGLTISDVGMNVTKEVGKDLAGSFYGTVAIGKKARFYMNYTIPGNFMIKGELPKLKFSDLVETLSNSPMNLPGGFDLIIPESTVLIKKQNENYNFQLGAKLADTTFMAMEVRKTNGQWGVAAGIAMTDAKPSSLPGLGVLKPIEKVVDLQDFTLVVSSFEGASFNFPNMAQFGTPALTSANIPMPQQSGGLVAGLNVYAKWKLDTSKKDLKLLKTILGLDPELGVTLQLGKDPSKEARLFVAYDTTIAGKNPLNCQFGFQLTNGVPELFLAGTTQVKIQKQLVDFNVAMSIVKSGFYFSGSMEGTVKFDHLQLSNMALALGFNWGGIPSLGVAATLDVKGFQSSLAVMFDSTDPSKSLLAGSISDVSLKDITLTVADAKDIPDNIEKVLDSIAISGAQPFNLPVSLSDELDDLNMEAVSQAFQESGKVTIPADSESVLLVVGKKGKKWNLTDRVNNMRHYQLERKGNNIRVTENAQLYFAPNGAQIGAIAYSEGFFMTGTLNVLGLKWTSRVDIRKSKGIAVSSSMNKALKIYKPTFFSLGAAKGNGGPEFSLSTFAQPELENEEFRQPHVYINGSLTLVGLKKLTYVKATKNGFAFEISEQLKLSVSAKKLASAKVDMGYTIRGSFDSIKNFSAGGNIDITLKGKLNLSAFKILGDTVSDMGKVSLDLSVASSTDMGYNGQEAYVKFYGSFEFQNIQRQFSQNLKASNADMTKTGEYVLDEMEQVLKQWLKVGEQFADAVKAGVIELDKGADQMAIVFKNGYGKSSKEAMRLMRRGGKEFREIGSAFKSAYNESAEDFADLMKGAGAKADDIADTLKSSFNADAKKVGRVLNKLKFSTKDITKALRSKFNISAKALMSLLKEFGKSTNDMAGILKNTYKMSSDSAAKTLKSVGVDARSVTKAMKEVYKLSAKQAGKLVKDAYDLGKDEMKSVLKGAGYASKEIESFTKSAYKSVKKKIRKLF